MAYPWGQCTYYISQRFPQIDGAMGNATNWVASAYKLGYPVLSRPVPNSVVVYKGGGQYSSDGHVAVVDYVNSDGTFTVSEMNFGGLGNVDTRRSTMDNVEGFVVPPGSGVPTTQYANFLLAKGSVPVAPNAQPGTNNAGPCITQWNLPFGSNLCMDGIIGGAAMAAGGAVMLGGVLVIVAAAFMHTKVGSTATKMVGPLRAVGAARAAKQATEHKTAQQTAAEEHQAATRRAQLRTSRARARVMEARARAPRSDEDKERAAERRIAATGKRPEPGSVKRGLAA